MNILEKKWSCNVEAKISSFHHMCILSNENLKAYITMKNINRAHLIVMVNYGDYRIRAFDKDIESENVLDKIDTIITKANEFPELISYIKAIIIQLFSSYNIIFNRILISSNKDYEFIDFYTDNEPEPHLRLQFDDLYTLSIFVHMCQIIEGHEYYIDVATHDINVNLYNIENTINKILKIQYQEHNKEEVLNEN